MTLGTFGCSPDAGKTENIDLKPKRLELLSKSSKTLSEKEVQKIAEDIVVMIEGPADPGSGFLLSHSDGEYTVATAWHVLRSAQAGDELWIHTSDNKKHRSSMDTITRVPGVDLGIVTFKSEARYSVAQIERNDFVDSGDVIYVSGYPKPTTSIPVQLLRTLSGKIVGISSKKIPDGYQLLYTNKTLPGMSGGPVLSARGGVIGVHGRAETDIALTEQAQVAVKTGTNQGVPVEYLLKAIDRVDLIETNRVRGKENEYIAKAIQLVEESKRMHMLLVYESEAFASNESKVVPASLTKRALEMVNKAIEINPQGYYYYLRGKYRFNCINYSLACGNGGSKSIKEDFRKAIELEPDLAEAYVALAKETSAYEDRDEVLRLTEKAISLNPRLVDAHIRKSFVAGLITDSEEAGISGEQWGRLHDQRRQASIDVLRRALKIMPLSYELNRELADKLKSFAWQLNEANPQYRRLLKESVDLYTKAISIKPIDEYGIGSDYQMRSSAYRSLGDFTKARNDEIAAVEMILSGNFPENKWLGKLASAYQSIGDFEDKLGNLESARSYYKKSIETLNIEPAKNALGVSIELHLNEIQRSAQKKMTLAYKNGDLDESCLDFDLWLATHEAGIRWYWFPESEELDSWKERCSGKVSPYRSVVQARKGKYYF
ncbi:serine protease [Synechococcus sp. LTW-R]|uniref:S1 family peptidase n=1 Tax=Synechococcus sp. LTW-R TaxID=2751170 RepID=UPI0016260CB2|nr:serine protease [Synechococcus sp. LTW-R]QNG30610.1 trypsin-like peptidase domain-containing protein [Synechococcus sp. LTW-R]